MSPRPFLLALILAVPLVGTHPVSAQAEKKFTKELFSFGTLRAPSPEEARG